MKILSSIALVIVLAALGIAGFAHSGLYDASATSTHSGLVNWFLVTTSRASIERRAKGIEVPDLDDEALVLAGINDFDSMCAGCHGAPGKNPEAIGQGLNPSPPDLAEEALEMSPAELFWVTRNGIKMTGMPAWGASHDDDALWPVVAFMMKLPGLDAAGYQAMLADARGLGHHADDTADDAHAHSSDDHATHEPEHHDPDSIEQPLDEAAQIDDAPAAQKEHDHSTHEH